MNNTTNTFSNRIGGYNVDDFTCDNYTDEELKIINENDYTDEELKIINEDLL